MTSYPGMLKLCSALRSQSYFGVLKENKGSHYLLINSECLFSFSLSLYLCFYTLLLSSEVKVTSVCQA